MRLGQRGHWLSIAFLLVLTTTSLTWAHDGDPKVRDRVAPYGGPGFRSAQNVGAQPFGPSFPRDGVQLLGWVTLAEMAPQIVTGADCWGYITPSGREYALMGHSHGMTVIDLANPGDPQVVDTVSGNSCLWRDVKIFGTYVYSVSECNDGIQVIDLSDVENGVVDHFHTVFSPMTSPDTHNIYIHRSRGILYRCGGDSNGLRMYDLNVTPTNPMGPRDPVQVGIWSTRYVHDAQVVTMNNGPFAGQDLAFCCTGLNNGNVDPSLTILDVTDPSNPVEISSLIYTSGEYSHQGALTANQQYFYLGDELDEPALGLPTTTKIIDVSDPTNPTEVGSFTNGNSAVGHNMYTLGATLYQANYRSGLRIFDTSNQLAPMEVAYFDTWISNDSPSFNGLWNVYPYFPSGIVIGSDLEKGLFVWHLGDVVDDCNGNQVDDTLEITLGIKQDCNQNGIPDDCDILGGLQDNDGNGVPDLCECLLPFIRGDANDDDSVNLADVILILDYVFASGAAPLPVIDSGDSNNDNSIDISDAVLLLGYLFGANGPPPPPYPDRGCEP